MEDLWTQRKKKLDQLLLPLCPKSSDLVMEMGLWAHGREMSLPKGGGRVVFSQALREFAKWLAMKRYGYETERALNDARKGLATFGLFLPGSREKVKEGYLMAKEAMSLFANGRRPLGSSVRSVWFLARLALIGKRGFSPDDLWRLNQGPRPFESQAFLALAARLEDDFGFRFPGRWQAKPLLPSCMGEYFSEAMDFVLERQGLSLTSSSNTTLTKRLSLRFAKALASSCLDGEGRLREPVLQKVILYFPIPSAFLILDVRSFLQTRKAAIPHALLALKSYGRRRL